MIYPVPIFNPQAGETAGQRIARIVKMYNGTSLSTGRAVLAALIGRGVDNGDVAVTLQTNCATFALGVLKAAGCPHPLLDKPYVIGAAFQWLMQIGYDYKAWIPGPIGLTMPKVGAAMHYGNIGHNNDHLEFFLDPGPPAIHGGGGRPDNAITVGPGGGVQWSWGRPVEACLDPDLLNIPVIAADVDVEPHPEIEGAHV